MATPTTNPSSPPSNDDKKEASTKATKQQRWFPLESNPTLINKYITKLGFDTSLYEFVDVYSTEDWALEMIPQPVVAVMMLYPLTKQQESAPKKDQILVDTSKPNIWFTKQRIGNACGTIGLLHTLMNIPEGLAGASIQPSSWLSQFQQLTPVSMSSIEKAELLEQDSTIAQYHDEATESTDNATSRGNIEDQVETHFIVFICGSTDNILYELDGRKDGPVIHGVTSPITLLQDSCKVIKEQFMARDPTEMRFTITALAPKVMD